MVRLLHADSSWLFAMDPNWLIHLPGSDLVARFGMKFFSGHDSMAP